MSTCVIVPRLFSCLSGVRAFLSHTHPKSIDDMARFSVRHAPSLSAGLQASSKKLRAPKDDLIHVKARARQRVHECAMIEDLTPNEVACPICGRPMTLQIIRRTFAESLYAFECK